MPERKAPKASPAKCRFKAFVVVNESGPVRVVLAGKEKVVVAAKSRKEAVSVLRRMRNGNGTERVVSCEIVIAKP